MLFIYNIWTVNYKHFSIIKVQLGTIVNIQIFNTKIGVQSNNYKLFFLPYFQDIKMNT